VVRAVPLAWVSTVSQAVLLGERGHGPVLAHHATIRPSMILISSPSMIVIALT
jgi:hypothetical protein